MWFATILVSQTFAQESATQQQIDQLNGRFQDVIESQAALNKRLDALTKDISELREKVNTPVVNDGPSREDVKKLAEQLQEVDRKRQADKELILENLKQLGKVSGDATTTTSHTKKKKTEAPKTEETSTPNPPAASQSGYDYVVKSGDTLGLIIKAYRDQGIKVTRTQVLKANPGLDPDKLFVGKKIIIPDPTTK